MRRSIQMLLPAAFAAWALAAPAGADDDPAQIAMTARLAALDGKFLEADGIIQHAPPEVQNDPALHLAIADLATKFAAGKVGEEKRDALFSARQHFAKVVELTPADAKAATGVIATAQTLGDLDVAAKKPDDGKAQASFAITCAEKSAAAGVATPDFKAALGRMYGFRCTFLKSMRDVDQLVADSTRAQKLLTEAAVGNENAYALFSYASQVRLRVANLIHENIPVETEKRDDEAMYGAIILGTYACTQPGATETDYATHLAALLLAHRWGMNLKDYKVFLQPIAPPLADLKLQQPRASGWSREKASADWDLVLDRNLHDAKNDGTVQLMLKQWSAKQTSLGKSWANMDEIAPKRFEKYKADLGEVSSSTDVVQLGAKGAPEVWFYAVKGKQKTGRIVHIGEWLWGDRKKDVYWQMKVIDWRPVPDLEEPDIVAFVGSAIGDGVWPKEAPAKAPPKKK